MKAFRFLFFLTALFIIPVFSYAQTTTTPVTPSVPFDTTGFPLWAKDLRRAEIVAFGSFPFAMFLSITAMDLYRYSSNDWDIRYAPWPAKPAAAIDMTQDEHLTVLASAVSISLTVALTDFIIVQIRRGKAAKAAAALPPGSPIIIRRPQSGTEPAAPPAADQGQP
ncbi:hypothetical protein AGMMS49928_05800 [Spirochaetia bacterium]|nr:hypothetical protein AGMMS49928_05800 [Spirochaetia bacterium]